MLDQHRFSSPLTSLWIEGIAQPIHNLSMSASTYQHVNVAVSTDASKRDTQTQPREAGQWFVDFVTHFEKQDAGWRSIVDTGIGSATSMSEILGLDD